MRSASLSDETFESFDTALDDHQSNSSAHLVGVLTIVGFVLVNVDLGTLGLPAQLPLSSLTWMLIAGAWLLPATRFVSPGRNLIDGATTWMLALFGLALLSATWSIHPARSLAAAAVSALIFLGAWVTTSEMGWGWIVRRASVALGLVAFVGLVRDVAADSLATSLGAIVGGEQRFSGVSFSPTDLGRIGAFGIVIALMAASTSAGRERRWHLAAAIASSGALISSGTRLVWFALICVGAVALTRRRTSSGFLVLATIGVAVAAFAVDPGRLIESLGRPGESDAHVLQAAGRTPVWSAALDLWSERPLLGYGWAGNEVVFEEAFFRDAIGFNAFTAHNLGIGVLVDLGIVGLTLLILGLIAAWRSTGSTPQARLVLLLVLLTGTIEATFSRPSLMMAVLGMVVGANRRA